MANPSAVRGAMKAAQAAPTIRAYHGSPHDFDRFDASKIGTGEGAQSYGHGLYFAENENVARGYRDSLAGQVLIDGQPLGDDVVGNDYVIAHAIANGQHDKLAKWRNTAQKRYDEQSRLLEGLRRDYARDPEADGVLAALGKASYATQVEADALDAFRRMDGRHVTKNPGHLYEVEIRHPESALLDWDRGWAKQSPHVQHALRSIGVGDTSLARAAGKNSYFDVLEKVDPELEQSSWWKASNLLSQSGVPGIKYLDQFSRSIGHGTRNFVMFPGTEDSITILRKYGLLPAVGAGAAAQGSQQNDQRVLGGLVDGGQ